MFFEKIAFLGNLPYVSVVRKIGYVRYVFCHFSMLVASLFLLSVFAYLNYIAHAFDTHSYIFRVGNILFSVETQTTEERTQLYHAEIDALYKDLTAKGKVLILSSEFGVGFFVCLHFIHASYDSFVNFLKPLPFHWDYTSYG